MQEYLAIVQERLRKETNKNTVQVCDQWLMKVLHDNDWEIPVARAKYVCEKLGLPFSEPSYYRKVVVWLPDVWHNIAPPCPNCGNGCSFHAWRDNHFGRLVVEL